MPQITERQEQLLKAIVEEYVSSAESVGSETITQKYDLNCSPATIRNEMVRLADEGLISKAHSSAGRTPTDLGFRYYIKHLMKEKKLPVVSEVALRQRLWEKRMQQDELLQSTVSALAEETESLSLATVEEGPFYYSGISRILNFPEFFDIDLTKSVLDLLDEHGMLMRILARANFEEPVVTIIGQECGFDPLNQCGFVFTSYDMGKRRGHLGVLGPARMNYPRIIPAVRYLGKLLEEITHNW